MFILSVGLELHKTFPEKAEVFGGPTDLKLLTEVKSNITDAETEGMT